MKRFYRIQDGVLEMANRENAIKVEDGENEFIEFEIGNEPEELLIELDNLKNESELKKHKEFLNKTDWYYARKMETGEEVPEEVVIKRVEAREFVRANEE